MSSESKISVVIVTYNCGEIIEDCIKSALWSDEVVIVDLGSTDVTLNICEKYALRVEEHSWVPAASLIREEIMGLASYEWVLELDPDERVSPGLANILRHLISTPQIQEVGCVEMPRQNIVFGKWLQHGNWWPDWQARFGRKNFIYYPSAIHHAGSSVNSETLRLDARPEQTIIHYPAPSMQKVYERVLRYAKRHASEYFANGMRFSYSRLVLGPLHAFFQDYIQNKGFLDGRAGFVYSFLWKFLYTAIIYLNIWELEGYPPETLKTNRHPLD
jgi:glycosyltransferase involved in cell wall biosynthesis